MVGPFPGSPLEPPSVPIPPARAARLGLKAARLPDLEAAVPDDW